MLKILTSLSFLYALTIAVLLVYGLFHYRDFVRSARQRRKFPFVFFIIGAACFGFLWINIHAPLRLKTFSNLDHHFIQHDGFMVNGSIELGKTDTVNFANNSFSNFVLTKKGNNVSVSSGYAEDPFYVSADGKYSLVSRTYPASGHSVSFTCNTVSVTIKAASESSFDLSLNGQNYSQKQL